MSKPEAAQNKHCRRLNPPSWQHEYAEAYAQIPELLASLGLQDQIKKLPPRIVKNFALRVPQAFARRMRHGDRHDPLLRQVLPISDEALPAAGFSADPLEEISSLTNPGLMQKYHGRALLIVTGACAVHCRYCFRREFPYPEQTIGPASLKSSLDRLAADRALTEVILSGGDPLSLSDKRLGRLLKQLDAIAHLRCIRIHTRLPVVLPSRVNTKLVTQLKALKKQLVLVIHCNHANEIDADMSTALSRLCGTGAVILNQSVLLRGVNDSVSALAALSERLFSARVLPYYLHQLDRVSGTAHFSVSDARALRLISGVAARLPGYLVPRLVREQSGAAAKLPIVANQHNPY